MLLDDEDYAEVNKWKWTLNKGYAQRIESRTQKNIVVHRLVMKAKVGQEVDHINRNPLDNRKVNLRFCTTRENRRNMGLRKDSKTGYKGVRANRKSFQAYINGRDGKFTHLGMFKDPKLAAIAYNTAAKKYFGEFAWLNPIK